MTIMFVMFQLNLIAEDLVRLLMHEQQMNKDKQILQEKLDNSMSQADIAALGLAVSVARGMEEDQAEGLRSVLYSKPHSLLLFQMDMKTIMLFSVTAVIAYFVISLFI